MTATDYNDLATKSGKAEVRRQLAQGAVEHGEVGEAVLAECDQLVVDEPELRTEAAFDTQPSEAAIFRSPTWRRSSAGSRNGWCTT